MRESQFVQPDPERGGNKFKLDTNFEYEEERDLFVTKHLNPKVLSVKVDARKHGRKEDGLLYTVFADVEGQPSSEGV